MQPASNISAKYGMRGSSASPHATSDILISSATTVRDWDSLEIDLCLTLEIATFALISAAVSLWL